MPRSKHLHSDYPLYFTLLEYPCAIAWKHVNSAAITPTLWLRDLLPTTSTSSLVAKALVNLASPNPCVPSVSHFFRQSWLDPDRQFAHSTEQGHINLGGNIALYVRELTTLLVRGRSAASVVIDVQMPSALRRHSHEHLAHSLDCLSPHLRSNSEGSWYELTCSFVRGKSPACDVLDIGDLSISRPRSLPLAVVGERRESAGTSHEMGTGYAWFSMDGLLWVACLILERSGLGLPLEVVAQIRSRSLSGAPICQHGELSPSHSARHRSNWRAAQLDETTLPEGQQRAEQFVGASGRKSIHIERSTSCFKAEDQ
jgi:hypothetical protein